MKSITIIMLALLSGCASTSEPNLLRGELFVNEQKNLEQKITLDKKNIYEITFRFR